MPQKVGVPVADLFAGLYGCIGILAALRHRERTGEGQHIDIGMLDTHVAWLANQGMNYLATGEDPPRLGNQHPNIVPYQVFPTADGHVVLSVGNDATFRRFCEAFDLTDLLDGRALRDQRRAGARTASSSPTRSTPVLRGQPTAWWVERLEALSIGCGPINRLSEVFADPQVQARGMVVEMPHAAAEGGQVKLIANPVRLSATPADYRIPPPLLGEHTEAVLGGCSAWRRRRSRRCARRAWFDAARRRAGARPPRAARRPARRLRNPRRHPAARSGRDRHRRGWAWLAH